MAAINHGIFGQVEVTLKSVNVTEDNLNLVDIGGVCLSVNGREYQLDYDQMASGIEGSELSFTLFLSSFEDTKECFDFCEFDLTMEDLRDPNLKTTIFFDCNEKNVELEFVSGQIEVDLGGEGVEFIKIDGNE